MSALPARMRVIEIGQPGGPDVLVPAMRDVPRPAAGEVLIQVQAAGVNGPDLMQRRGLYPAPKGASDLLGLEVSGHIVALGDGVSGWSIGDAVCALTNGGGYAQFCAVDARHCLPVPAPLSVEDAAGLPETFFTVWSNVFMGARLQPGERLLVHGGAGGIGLTAIQLGKAFGAEVVATESPAERCAQCAAHGADLVIDFRNEDFVEAVRARGGADVVLDIVGGSYIERNIRCCRHDGRIVQLAFALGSKAEIDFMPVMLKRVIYTGSTLRTRSPEFKAQVAQDLLGRVWPKIGEGLIRPVTFRVLELDDAAAAHRLMESAGHVGKIILRP